jgi:hypothetical protein
MIAKIISGGQTGVDRAALDVALELGIPCGGWCPKGRKAEDGPLSERYPLTETSSPFYAHRTRCNVSDSDGTLVLTRGQARGGTELTIKLAGRYRKPCLVVDLSTPPETSAAKQWVKAQRVRVLNVAGPRESEQPGIYAQAVEFLRQILS